jgi:hypothetical protein
MHTHAWSQNYLSTPQEKNPCLSTGWRRWLDKDSMGDWFQKFIAEANGLALYVKSSPAPVMVTLLSESLGAAGNIY